MDYLRQQIEASLGRSEELLISDKARRTFYRYPPDPGPSRVPPPSSSSNNNNNNNKKASKSSSKERSSTGTFNSVRLKKYLGLGGSGGGRKSSKVALVDVRKNDEEDCIEDDEDDDELHQQLQQRAYLEELQRYGAPMPHPGALYYDGTGQLAVYNPGRLPWMMYSAAAPQAHHGHHVSGSVAGRGNVSGRTTVAGGGQQHQRRNLNNIYSSVNVKSGGHGHLHQRGALQKALRAWEPYVPPVSSSPPPLPEEFLEYRSMAAPANCNSCTCQDHPALLLQSGPKSRSKQRPSSTTTNCSSQCTCHVAGTSTMSSSSKSRSYRNNMNNNSSGISSMRQLPVRPTLFVDHVRSHNPNSSATSSAGSSPHRPMSAGLSSLYVVDVPRRPTAPGSSSVKGSGANRSSRVTSMAVDVVRSPINHAAIPKRRSILECSVNPYDLLAAQQQQQQQQQRTRRRSAPPRINTAYNTDTDEDKQEPPNCHTHATSISRSPKDSQVGVRNRLSADSSSNDEDYDCLHVQATRAADNESAVTNISLGGQRIRLFDTVRGTMSVRGNSSSPFKSRPPLPPSFAADVVAAAVRPRKNGFASYADLCLPRISSPGSSITPPVDKMALIRNSGWSPASTSASKKDNRTKFNSLWMSNQSARPGVAGISAAAPLPHQQQHKTTISIGRSASEERILDSPSACKVQSALRESRSDSCLRKIDKNNDDVVVVVSQTPSTTCHTVIAVGQANTARHARLNLKINLSELSAYLKPILKKAGLRNDVQSSMSSSSEACSSEDNSDCAVGHGTSSSKSSSLMHATSSRDQHNDDDDHGQLRRKKRVHFLSSRLSTASEASLASSSSSEPSSAMSEQSSPDAKVKADDSDSSDSSECSTRDLYDDVMYVSGRDRDAVKDVLSAASLAREISDDHPVTTPTIVTLDNESKRDLELFNKLGDSKLVGLRRSQSERQVGVVDLDPATATTSTSTIENGTGKLGRLTPTRSKSFQCFPSSSNVSSTGKAIAEDGNDNDVNTERGKMLTFYGSNNLNCPTEDVRKKYTSGKDIVRQSTGAIVFESNFKEDHQDSASASMDVAKLKSIPKFLPRPSYRGRHVPVCSLYAADELNSPPSSESYSENSNSRHDTSDWTQSQSLSEEDIYADGSSSAASFERKYSNEVYNKPLPAPPDLLDRGSSTSSSEDNGGDSSAIYEQIREPVEPLYEEVLDAVSYTSAVSSSAGSTGSTLGQPRKSIFEGASRTEILSYLEDAKERGLESIDNDENSGGTGVENGEGGDGGGGGSRNGSSESCGDVNGLNGVDGCGDDDDDRHRRCQIDEDEQPKHLTGLNQNIGAKRNHRNRISNLSNLSDSSHTSEESFQNEDLKDTKDRHSHSSAEVERNDSGVGSETSKPSRLRRQSRLGSSEQICVDCDQNLEPIYDTESDTSLNQLVCRKCSKKRSERKEIILEIVETEIKYGRDLKIIKEEFHRPMLVAGLLSEDLLSNIFLNLDQLVEVNDLFAEKLKDALEIAAEQGDEDYSTVNVGKVFQDSSAMLHAFEAYCVRQGTASLMLTNLEKEKELLRIFLKVSQMENTLLRRLNLNSFLMVPVQRVTKYPLLLNRLYKVTPHHHQDRESLREAQLKIELHLEHINQQAKDLSGMNLWRRISNISNSQRKNILEPVLGNVKLRKMALQILQWSSDDARFALEGRLLYAAVTDNVWNKREKTLKLIPVHGLLITLGTPNSNYRPDLADRDDQSFPRNTGIRETCLVLVKEKGNRFNLLREPLQLQRCVISSEPDTEDIFEIQELTTKDAYLLKAEDSKDTAEWLRLLRYHAKDLGAWRRRRNALANIMINGMVARREWL